MTLTEGKLLLGNAQVDSTSITFSPDATASNGLNTPQTVQVKGQGDAVADGEINYRIITSVSSLDPNYAAIDPTNVGLTNKDNEFGLTISPAFLWVFEGQTATITAVLNLSPPRTCVSPYVVPVGARNKCNASVRKWCLPQRTGMCRKPLW